jgi:phenylacetate-CoA ligase
MDHMPHLTGSQNVLDSALKLLEAPPVSKLRLKGTATDFIKLESHRRLQYWESEATRPRDFWGASATGQSRLEDLAKDKLQACLNHPFKSIKEIRQEQFERVKEIVTIAYNDIPVYAEKYRAVGFRPGLLKSWADFEQLPIMSKDELIAAYPDSCVSKRWPLGDLFSTRSFGTSGKTLPIKVNQDAILTDTLQGVRQFWLQSGLKFTAKHMTSMIYTVPWWFETVGDDFVSAFISGIIHPEKVTQILNEVKPHVISCYPTTLKGLIPYWQNWDHSNLYLVVVHSEGSSFAERQAWSKQLNVPVLDEYSSEEATRIALECPCGHYHVCEDAVYLEVLDPKSHRPKADGESGMAVVTNLLNEAMPFIRYHQGDYVTRPSEVAPCLIGWSQLASIDGRINDSFIDRDDREVPAGAILDVVYRWMFDSGIYLDEFQLMQKSRDKVEVAATTRDQATKTKFHASLDHLEDLLLACMNHPVEVEANLLNQFPAQPGKRRVIRRDFTVS